MGLFVFSILLAALSSVMYHVIQKVTPSNANPALALFVTYGVSMLGCLVLLAALYPLKGGLAQEIKRLNWASIALGFSLIGLELGALLAYRAGWNLSLASMVINVTAALLLIPIGLLLFKEKLTLTSALGIVFCLVGLILINWKK